MPSRRRFLATCVGGIGTLAGCLTSAPDPRDRTTTASPGRGTTETETSTPGDDTDRPTRTPRDTKPIDVAGTWPQVGFEAGHGGVTDATGVPDDGDAYWNFRRVRSGPPVLSDGRLFHHGLLNVGERETATPTPTPSTETARSLDGRPGLFCRDARDGRVLWTRELDARGMSPAVTAGRVLVSGDGFVAAYRASDGRRLWQRDLGNRGASSPTVVGGTAFVATQIIRRSDRKPDVRAYRVADGGRRWSAESPMWQADLAATGDTVIALSSRFQVGSVLTARSLADGSEQWSVDIDDDGIPLGPFVAGGTVYVAPDDDGVYAFDLANGERRWHYEAETPNTVGVAASADEAYLVDDGRLLAVDPDDGAERWTVTSAGDRGYRGVPAVGADAIYLDRGGFPADFVALSRSDGAERWSVTLPETTVEGDMVTSGLAAQPIVAEGAVYAYAEDGLYAFGPR